MFRRSFVRALLSVPCAALPAACRRPPTRGEVLAGVIREVVAPNTRALLPASAALAAAGAALAVSVNPRTLGAARDAWRSAALGWRTASLFQEGPLVESKALLRASYWPILPAAIEELLARSSALDEHGIEELSLSQKGVYALEYLLFPEGDEQAALELFGAARGERRRALVAGLGRDLARHAQRVITLLGDGSAFADRHERGGQLSLSRWVGQLILGIETLAVNPVDSLLRLAAQRPLRPSDLEGSWSGTSHQLLRAVLFGAEQLYRGGRSGGLADLVRAAAPAIAERAEAAFRSSLSSAKGLKEPLESLAKRSPQTLRAALDANKALEKTLKVEVSSALGVTLTFQSADGD